MRPVLLAAGVLITACLAPVMVRPAPASATFAGPVGRLAYVVQGERPAGQFIVPYSDIMTSRPDGTDQRRVSASSTPGLVYPLDGTPSWSPDGTRIAYGHMTGYDAGEVRIMDADGSHSRSVVPTAAVNCRQGSCQALTGIDWSPDGTRLAYQDSSNTIQIVDSADGGNRTMIGSGINFFPRWSPDGTQILYSKTVGFRYFNFWEANADGSNERQITTQQTGFQGFGDWSPDGTKIVYQYFQANDQQLWQMNADGSQQTQLTHEVGLAPSHPVWSPDGSRIDFDEHGSRGDLGLFQMNSDGTDITAIPRTGDFPSWQAAAMSPDVTPPTVTISEPGNGADLKLGFTINVSYRCEDIESGIASCVGTVPDGSPLDTSSIGTKSFAVTATDRVGNTVTRTSTYYVHDSTSGDVPASGGTVTSNPDPSPADPIGASVVVPDGTGGGGVYLTTSGDSSTRPPHGFNLLGYQVRIEAPVGTWDNPLVLTFTLDPSVIPDGTDPDQMHVVRDGVIVSNCPPGATTAIAPDDANPDGQPCLQSHQVLGNGDVQFTVLTPHASDWNFTAPK